MESSTRRITWKTFPKSPALCWNLLTFASSSKQHWRLNIDGIRAIERQTTRWLLRWSLNVVIKISSALKMLLDSTSKGIEASLVIRNVRECRMHWKGRSEGEFVSDDTTWYNFQYEMQLGVIFQLVVISLESPLTMKLMMKLMSKQRDYSRTALHYIHAPSSQRLSSKCIKSQAD